MRHLRDVQVDALGGTWVQSLWAGEELRSHLHRVLEGVMASRDREQEGLG